MLDSATHPSEDIRNPARKGMPNFLRDGASDVAAALANPTVATVFGWQDVAQRYQRSKLGAFWITISVGIMIGALSFLFGALLNAPLHDFLPFVAVGLILWTFIAAIINDGCIAFVESATLILQVRLPLFTHIMRITWRNLIVLAHNLIIIPIVFVIFQVTPRPAALLAIPGFAVLLLNVTWIALILAVLTSRFRDITQTTQNLMQIAFFLTPIMWMPHVVADRVPPALLELNPFYHIIALVRDPLLGHAPSAYTWLVGIGFAASGWLVALTLFGRFRKRVSYWL